MYRHNFKKKWGQNWLKNTEHVFSLIESVELRADDSVVEVGPGIGAITEFLPMNCKEVIAIEIDSELVEYLGEKYEHIDNLRFVNANILQVDLAAIGVAAGTHKLVGALPYNISKKIISKLLLDDIGIFKIAVFIIQKEVAESYAGEGKKGTLLNHIFSCFYTIKIVNHIEKSAFKPEPKVESSIIKFRLKPRSHWNIDLDEVAEYRNCLINIFRNPRKKLIKNLNSIYKNYNWVQYFAENNISENARAEELSQKQVLNIYNFVNS